MSSGVANFGRIDFDDLQWESRRYSARLSYAQCKLADLMMTRQLSGDRRRARLEPAEHRPRTPATP